MNSRMHVPDITIIRSRQDKVGGGGVGNIKNPILSASDYIPRAGILPRPVQSQVAYRRPLGRDDGGQEGEGAEGEDRNRRKGVEGRRGKGKRDREEKGHTSASVLYGIRLEISHYPDSRVG